MRHVRMLAIAWLVTAGLVTVASLAGIVYFLTVGEDAKTAGELLFLAIGTSPAVPAAVWLPRRRRWARVVLLVEGALVFMAVPIGTVLGLYTFWVLLIRGESAALFGEAAGAVPRE